MIRNRLHSLLHRHNLALPEEGLISWEWWEQQELSALEKLQVRQEIALLEEVDKHKAQVDTELGKLSTGKLWGKQATYLMQLPGIGVIVAMTVLIDKSVKHRTNNIEPILVQERTFERVRVQGVQEKMVEDK